MDYRKLNLATIKDAYPLPRIDDTLDMLAGKQWFSTLDLASGYWQVSLSPEARCKTAFATHSGLFQFRVMPFGLCNAPATFERLMDRVLQGLRLWLANHASTENHAAVTGFETVATDFHPVATDFETAAVEARARRCPNDDFVTLHLASRPSLLISRPPLLKL